MKKETFALVYEVYDSAEELSKEDALLLRKAQDAVRLSYAPYSHFHVGTAALLQNGEWIEGSNQENASFPVGICSERVLLSVASSRYPGVPIVAMAVSYKSDLVSSNHPISPCGLCRQTLQEYELRLQHPIRLILGGMDGKVWVLPNTSQLLPLSFTSDDLEIKETGESIRQNQKRV
ncbi:MAG: cytidine deaminase [Williamsia sp.]|nr:cytidine deaminase [Williamsia sp.]